MNALRNYFAGSYPIRIILGSLVAAVVADGIITQFLVLNGFDHVFFGTSNQSPNPHPEEVSDWAWVTLEELEHSLVVNTEKYSVWLQKCFSNVVTYKLREVRASQPNTALLSGARLHD